MPKNEFFQENPKDKWLVEIHQRLEVLERQFKQINAFELYMKRIIKVEERLGLLNSRAKVGNEESDRSNQGDLIKDFEEQVLVKARQLIQMEREPIQNMFVEFQNRIVKLENQISSLEKKSTENIKANQNLKNKQEEAPKENPHEGQPIIFQEIHIDKLFMDKYEQTNNLGQLGIKELSGHLNIGATYDKGVIPNELVEEWKKEMNSLNQMKENQLKNETDEDCSNNREELAKSDDEG